jgi:hypothetical protein
MTNFVRDDWKDLALHLGVDFLSAIVVFVAFDILLQRIEEDKVKTRKALNYGYVIDNIYNAQEEVHIWESWTNLFSASRKGKHTFEDAIKHALQRGARFHILLVRPGSAGMNKRQIDLDGEDEEHANYRKDQNWPEDRDVELNVLRNLQHLHEIYAQLPKDEAARLAVRLYDSPPTVALYAWGAKACASFFPEKQFSDRIEQLEFSTDTGVGKLINGQFNIMWDRSLPYKHEPEYMRVWLADPQDRLISSFEVAFIKNDEEDKYGEGSYPFCIADPQAGVDGIAARYDASGYMNLRVICRGKEAQKDEAPAEDKLPDSGDRYFIERYEHETPRMPALFDAKYGPDPKRQIFTLKRDTTKRDTTRKGNNP